jgi:hypothetical protein
MSMTPVTVVGLVFGGALIAAAIYVFVKKQEFALNGVAVTLLGLLLIGMSQWTTIKIKGAGIDIDLSTLQRQLSETAEAVDALAEETVNAAAAAETTREQLLTLSNQLERQRVLPPSLTRPLRDSLRTGPRIDTAVVNAARVRLRPIIRQ